MTENKTPAHLLSSEEMLGAQNQLHQQELFKTATFFDPKLKIPMDLNSENFLQRTSFLAQGESSKQLLSPRDQRYKSPDSTKEEPYLRGDFMQAVINSEHNQTSHTQNHGSLSQQTIQPQFTIRKRPVLAFKLNPILTKNEEGDHQPIHQGDAEFWSKVNTIIAESDEKKTKRSVVLPAINQNVEGMNNQRKKLVTIGESSCSTRESLRQQNKVQEQLKQLSQQAQTTTNKNSQKEDFFNFLGSPQASQSALKYVFPSAGKLEYDSGNSVTSPNSSKSMFFLSGGHSLAHIGYNFNDQNQVANNIINTSQSAISPASHSIHLSSHSISSTISKANSRSLNSRVVNRGNNQSVKGSQKVTTQNSQPYFPTGNQSLKGALQHKLENGRENNNNNHNEFLNQQHRLQNARNEYIQNTDDSQQAQLQYLASSIINSDKYSQKEDHSNVPKSLQKLNLEFQIHHSTAPGTKRNAFFFSDVQSEDPNTGGEKRKQTNQQEGISNNNLRLEDNLRASIQFSSNFHRQQLVSQQKTESAPSSNTELAYSNISTLPASYHDLNSEYQLNKNKEFFSKTKENNYQLQNGIIKTEQNLGNLKHHEFSFCDDSQNPAILSKISQSAQGYRQQVKKINLLSKQQGNLVKKLFKIEEKTSYFPNCNLLPQQTLSDQKPQLRKNQVS